MGGGTGNRAPAQDLLLLLPGGRCVRGRRRRSEEEGATISREERRRYLESPQNTTRTALVRHTVTQPGGGSLEPGVSRGGGGGSLNVPRAPSRC